MSKKEIFVMYSWNPKSHNKKVLSFVNFLINEGYEVDVDKLLSQERTSIDFGEMMHRAITDYEKIIIVLSKGYKIKAEKFQGGVGAEFRMVFNDIDSSKNKYILICFEGINDDIIPLGFKGREILDLRKKENYNVLNSRLQNIKTIVFPKPRKHKPPVKKEEIEPFEFEEFEEKNKSVPETIILTNTEYPTPNPLFKGQKILKQKIIKRILSNDSAHIVSQIRGMGGIGKSELATQIVAEIKKHNYFRYIVWYKLSGYESFEDTLKRISKLLKIDIEDIVDDFQFIKNRIRKHIKKMKVFFVLDNADYNEELFRPIYDLLKNAPLLITGRREYKLLPATSIFPIDVLLLPDAIDLAIDKLRPNKYTFYGTKAELIEIIEKVGRLPLAINIMCAVIKEERWSFKNYLKHFKIKRLDADDLLDELEKKNRSIKASLELSTNLLNKKQKRFLSHISTFSKYTSISMLLLGIIDNELSKELKKTKNKERHLRKKYLDKLVKYSLIEYVEFEHSIEPKSIKTHAIVREFAKGFNTTKNINKGLILKYTQIINSIENNELDNINPNEVIKALVYLSEKGAHHNFIEAYKKSKTFLLENGYWNSVISLLKRVLNTQIELGNVIAQIHTLERIGDMLVRTKQYEEAYEYLTKLLSFFDEYRFDNRVSYSFIQGKYLLNNKKLSLSNILDGLYLSKKMNSNYGQMAYWGEYSALLHRNGNYEFYEYFEKRAITYNRLKKVSNLHNEIIHLINHTEHKYRENPKIRIDKKISLITGLSYRIKQSISSQIFSFLINYYIDKKNENLAEKYLKEYHYIIDTSFRSDKLCDYYFLQTRFLLGINKKEEYYLQLYNKSWKECRFIDAALILLHDYENITTSKIDYNTLINSLLEKLNNINTPYHQKMQIKGLVGFYLYKKNKKGGLEMLFDFFADDESAFGINKLRFAKLYNKSITNLIPKLQVKKQKLINNIISPQISWDKDANISKLRLPAVIITTGIKKRFHKNTIVKNILFKKNKFHRTLFLNFQEVKEAAQHSNYTIIDNFYFTSLFNSKKNTTGIIELYDLIDFNKFILLKKQYKKLVELSPLLLFRIVFSYQLSAVNKFIVLESLEREGLQYQPETILSILKTPNWFENEFKNFQNKVINNNMLPLLIQIGLDIKSILALKTNNLYKEKVEFVWVNQPFNKTNNKQGLIGCINEDSKLYGLLMPSGDLFSSVNVGVWFLKYIT